MRFILATAFAVFVIGGLVYYLQDLKISGVFQVEIQAPTSTEAAASPLRLPTGREYPTSSLYAPTYESRPRRGTQGPTSTPDGFKGPSGPPHIIGPSGPPPNY